MPIRDVSWFDSVPNSCSEKGIRKGSSKFYPNPTISSAQITCRAHPTFPIPQHKYNLIILYQGKTSQLNICLKSVAIICQSEQVDKGLSQPILALP